MTERATTFQTVQIGLESVAGTAVAAGKLLQASEVTLGIKNSTTKFRPGGQKFITVVAPNMEWAEGSYKMAPPTFDEIVYWLSASHKKVSPSTDGTLPKLWTIAPAYNDADTIATYTVEIGSSVRAHEAPYVIAPEFSMKWSRKNGIEVSGKLLANAITDGITMTSTPTAIATVPMVGNQVDVKLADTMAGLDGASALDRPLSAEYSLADRFGPVWPLKSAAANWPAHVETPPNATMKLLLEADSAGMGLLTQMRAGSSKYIRVSVTGANIESGKPYLCELSACVKVVGDPDEFKDEDGLYAIGWNLECAYDSTAGYAMQWKVRNLLASL
jgi:hypothetical protein